MVDVQWWLSGYDGQVHAFRGTQVGKGFGEAFCEHCVPTSLITCTDEGQRCMACLLMVGDLLAERLDATWRAS